MARNDHIKEIVPWQIWKDCDYRTNNCRSLRVVSVVPETSDLEASKRKFVMEGTIDGRKTTISEKTLRTKFQIVESML